LGQKEDAVILAVTLKFISTSFFLKIFLPYEPRQKTIHCKVFLPSLLDSASADQRCGGSAELVGGLN